ncbi:MAG: acetylxylan esterase [Candidatus Latescibacterota bacterium]|jgi:cephalosporin-C deacetylase
MASVDWPYEQLVDYKPDLTKNTDFDSFWDQNLAASKGIALNAEFVELEDSLPGAKVYDVAFDGADGVRVRGWYMAPLTQTKPLPAVVHFIGYMGGRDYPHALSAHVLNGFCAFIMDSRGMGGNTGMRLDTSHGAQSGFITHGILGKDEYFYRHFYLRHRSRGRCYCRARRSGCDEVDATKICAIGGSQGGALSIACASLSDKVVAMAPDVPWLSHFKRSVDLAIGPYEEITNFLKSFPQHIDQAFDALSYFDNMNLVTRTQVKDVYYSVGLWDAICPPSTVYASYNHMPTGINKSIEIYHYNGHEGGGNLHQQRKLKWLREKLA